MWPWGQTNSPCSLFKSSCIPVKFKAMAASTLILLMLQTAQKYEYGKILYVNTVCVTRNVIWKSHLDIDGGSDYDVKFSDRQIEYEWHFPYWGAGQFTRHFNGQSVQLSHQCTWTCVHQFSPFLAVLFFFNCVCSGVNSWTSPFSMLSTHVLSCPSFCFFFNVLFSPSIAQFSFTVSACFSCRWRPAKLSADCF